MQSVVTYVRNLLGWCEEDRAVRTSFKRDRTDEDICLSNDTPTLKRLKRMRKTSFPDNMDSKDMWEESKQNKNIRYVPIRLEPGHPSTSTPNSESLTNIRSRIRTVPIKLVDVSHNGPTSLPRKSYIPTPTKPIMRAIIKDDDDDDDDQEVTWIETKSETKKPKVYINLDDDDDEDNDKQEDDVIFVKKVTTPPAVIPYKYFLTKSALPDPKEEQCVKFYKVCNKPNDKNGQNSPRTINKFKTPAGITKVYKKVPAPLPKWMQNQKTNLSLSRNKFSNLNGNARSTLSEVFNLDEKRNYQELIKKFSDTTRHVSLKKPRDIIEIAEDAASFRCTQKSQKSSLNELKLMGKSYSLDKGKELEEYDPITVASINSSDSEIEIIPSDTSTTSSVRVDPINTLRESLKDRPVTSSDWLLKLDSKYKKKKEETKAKLKDAHRESDIISKVNYEQKLAHLEHKLKYELSIPESLIEEVPPAVELPPLTPEQEKLVNKALGPGPPGQLLVEKFNLRIHRRDLQTLSGLNWLNDEVINFYMNLLMQRCEEQKDLPKVYATNTFFYPKLMQSGQAGLRRWTRKVDIFVHDLMVVPVHLGVHWCLSLIDFRRKKISYLDSMGGANHACLHALMQYLRDEHLDKKGQPLDDSGWTTENLKDIPQQMNGSDCGVFACTFAEFACRDAPYAFSQAHMPYLRRKAALELLRARLLL